MQLLNIQQINGGDDWRGEGLYYLDGNCVLRISPNKEKPQNCDDWDGENYEGEWTPQQEDG